MRIVSSTLAVLAAFPFALAAQQPQPVPSTTLAVEPPTIVATGSGEARTPPDRAMIQIGVQSRGATAAAASAANNVRQRAIIDTLVALGIPRDQIATTQFNVYPEMRPDPTGREPRVSAYVVSNVVRVELRRIEQVSAAIDAALAKGANQIHALNFYAFNTDEPRRQALSQAVQRARADAEAMARAAGGSLGELVELSTGQSVRPLPIQREMAMARSVAADVATPIEPGEEMIRAQVTARWRFIPAR